MVKHYMILISLCLAVMLATPLLALPKETRPSESPDLPVMLPKEERSEPSEAKAFRLKLSQSGEIIERTFEMYNEKYILNVIKEIKDAVAYWAVFCYNYHYCYKLHWYQFI